MSLPLFRAAGPAERFLRGCYSGGLRRIGIARHLTRAQGAWFAVDVKDYIDSCVAYDGMWDAPQMQFLADAAMKARADLFLDVGANTGFYSIMFAVKNL